MKMEQSTYLIKMILSHLLKPQMYMVIQPMKEMSEKAVEILLHHIRSKSKKGKKEEKKGEDSKTSTRRINGLSRCPTIDINLGE